MADDPISIRPEWAADFERMGTSALAAALPRYQGEVRAAAMAWLGQKEREFAAANQERFSRSESLSSENNLIARKAMTAAIVAAIAAIAANVLAMIGIIISVLTWVYPHVAK